MDVVEAVQEPEFRESFIEDIVILEFGREALSHQTLGQDSNNYVYLVELSGVVHADVDPTARERRFGTAELPVDVKQVVIRISNPSANLNENCRVENEVAAMALARDALAGEWESIVPKVYGWGPSGSDFGWMIQEYKLGEPLENHFDGFRIDLKRGIIRQIVSIFKRLQEYRLPESILGYGGLAFNEAGQIVTGESAVPSGGPFNTLPEMYAELFLEQLDGASLSPQGLGWFRTGLRGRLEYFAYHHMRDLVREFAEDRQTLVHGDINTFNILFDPATKRITALLDFDFAHIASPADEYFHSFSSLSSILVGPFEAGDVRQLHDWILRGFEGFTTPMSTGLTYVDWEVAQMMNDELVDAEVRRPVDIPGSGELAGLKWFSEDICAQPYAVAHWLGNMGIKDADNHRLYVEEKLECYLMRWL